MPANIRAPAPAPAPAPAVSTAATTGTPSSPTPTTTPPAAPTASADPHFVGWSQVGLQSGTPIYSPGSCPASSTLSTSASFATCCDSGPSHPCTLYTSCEAGNSAVLGPAGGSSRCGTGSTCKTDTIYRTVSDVSSTVVVYCGTGPAGAAVWFREMPSPGVAVGDTVGSGGGSGGGNGGGNGNGNGNGSQGGSGGSGGDGSIPATPVPGNGYTFSAGAIGGGVVGFVFLVGLCVLACYCLGCLCGGRGRTGRTGRYVGGGGGGGYPMGNVGLSASEREQDRWREDEYARQIREQEDRRREAAEAERQRQQDAWDRQQQDAYYQQQQQNNNN
ncbi:hypothetical protein QBC47DRAFT_417384 [Echria macrotheca]|uniref:Uncharacterized protein n=1 Tax=Echria macrotheca TaxID=438768 RepID=A0AAJ0F5L5_9PEZI|nr:hypothetical protein QBC47DRAFT_417384 [Echria macrotheca]